MVRRTTWILLGVLGAVALAFFVLPAAEPDGEDEPVPSVERMWDVPSEEVASIRLVDLSTGKVITARRDAEVGWRLSSHAGRPADSGSLEMGVASLAALGIDQRIADPEDRKAFGLDPAAYRLTLIRTDGSAHSADVGRVDPTGSAYYVHLPGTADVLLVSRYALEDALGWLAQPPLAEPSPVPTGTP